MITVAVAEVVEKAVEVAEKAVEAAEKVADKVKEAVDECDLSEDLISDELEENLDNVEDAMGDELSEDLVSDEMDNSSKRESNIQNIDGTKYRVDDNGKPYAQYNPESGSYDLLPNSNYTLNGYEYNTDELGRITKAEGDVKLKDHDGKRTINESIKDMKPTDDKGHLIADTFEGQNDVGNLVPMDGNLNRGQYKSMELQIKKALENGQEVHIKVEPQYTDASSTRPDSFKIKYSIDGVDIERCFKNVPNGGIA